jgi:hypothetical protein
LVQSLLTCCIPTEGAGVHAEEASDHLPVVAEFGEVVGAKHAPQLRGSAEEVGV